MFGRGEPSTKRFIVKINSIYDVCYGASHVLAFQLFLVHMT